MRLENIRRNEAFLSSIGIADVKPSPVTVGTSSTKKERPMGLKKRSLEIRAPTAPSRRSLRLRGLKQTNDLEESEDFDEQLEKEEGGDGCIDYDTAPLGPEDLDDYEFFVFVAAKAWRLAKCRALETEPYKVFNNRAMCDIIRRRRNDKEWALHDRNDLLHAWGTAEKKLATGLPIELIEVLEEEENAANLEASRKICTPKSE